MSKELWLLNPPKKRTRKVRRKRTRKNPALALYGNPRKKGRVMAKRKKTTRRRVYHRRRKTHSMRANPPRRRRSLTARKRRRFHRNPGSSGTKLFGGMSIPPVKRIAGGVAGMTAARVIPGYAKKFFPQLATMGGGVDLALGALSGLFAGMMAGKFMGKQFGEDVAFGAILGVTDDALRMYVYPAAGLSAYLEPQLSAYLEPGLHQYLSPGATIPALGDLNYDFNNGDEMGAADLPARLNPNNRL